MSHHFRNDAKMIHDECLKNVIVTNQRNTFGTRHSSEQASYLCA